MSETLNTLADHVRGKLDGRIRDVVMAYGELTIVVDADDIVSVMTFLRDDARCRFISIIDVAGVDYPARAKRFDVVYHLLSPRQNLRIRVKVHDRRGYARSLDHRSVSRRGLVRARGV